MKKKELNTMREKKVEELSKLVMEKRKEISLDYAKRTGGQEKNIKKVKGIRKDLAQILTVIREKEIAGKEATKK